MLNAIWVGLILTSIVLGVAQGRMEAVVATIATSATQAVTLAISLVGIMSFWLGLMKIAEQSGLVQHLGRCLHPLLKRLFPEVPANHPAMGAMTMNLSANMLGLGNAATPFGLRAMTYLQELNPHAGVASNAMCTFLALNTSSIQLVPVTSMAILAAHGDGHPTRILIPTLITTACSTLAAIVAVRSLQHTGWFALPTHAPQSYYQDTTPQAYDRPQPQPARAPLYEEQD